MAELPPSLADRIRSHLAARDPGTAANLLAEHLETTQTGSYALYSLLGSLFFQDGRHLNAAVAFKHAEALAPLDPPDRFTLAMAYVLLGRNDWARPELDRLCSRHPENPLHCYWLARLDFDDRRYAEAIERLHDVVDRFPDFLRAVDRLALSYQYLGMFAEAETWFRRALELNAALDRPWEWPYIDYGAMLLEQGRIEEARTMFEDAVRAAPENPVSHYQLALALEKLGSLREAAASLDRCVALDPQHTQAWWALVRVRQRLGDRQGAQEALRRFQESSPQ
ncbi:MAG: hypothetical protein Kow00109_09500 [Acidobacteriota bacterium]